MSWFLRKATLRNVNRALREVSAFEWEGDYRLAIRHALNMSFGFLMILKGHYEVLFSAMVVLVVNAVIFVIVLIIPSVNPYRSAKGLPMKLEKMMVLEEKLIFYRHWQDSALFYTNRPALVVKTPERLMDLLTSD